MSKKSSVFSDFCLAWEARFPGSELPAAWEEDVRANLHKHKNKVASLREEIEKEEMYVEYLNKLLVDIERHRKTKADVGQGAANASAKDEISKQKFLDSHLEDFRKVTERADLRLELAQNDKDTEDESTFVTVINVPSPTRKKGVLEETRQPPMMRRSTEHPDPARQLPPKPQFKRSSVGQSPDSGAKNRDSLNSVSSPTTPTSPLFSNSEEIMTSARESINTLSPLDDSFVHAKLSSSSEETIDDGRNDQRGRPDGRDNVDDLAGQKSKVSKVKELTATWEKKPPIAMGQPVKPKRHDSDSSNGGAGAGGANRGRMGSPSGKSHDSSDSDTNASDVLLQVKSTISPSSKKKMSGEIRLDRLVRKPSRERHSEALPVPVLPKPLKKPKAKPRTLAKASQEHLYDTVAADEPEDEYDNHLLYGTGSSGGRSSSADLGFDEPKPGSSALKSAHSGQSLTGSGTLSSCETTEGFSSSPTLERVPSLEEETNYVNIQYFLQANNNTKAPSSSTMAVDIVASDDDEIHNSEKVSSSSREDLSTSIKQQDAKDDEDRMMMQRCVLDNVVDTEAVYLEGLSVMLQYAKALKVTLTTPQAVIPREDFDIIFYKIPELHDLHYTFHDKLKRQVGRQAGSATGDKESVVGHTFKMLASRCKIYGAFLNNYPKALDALHRCTEAYPQFADLTRSIKVRSVTGQAAGQSLTMSLEDLLHKPVARVQKLSLSLQDLIKYTPESHGDFVTLSEALQQVQTFLHEYNVLHASQLFPHRERQQRHLVKNSFIVELSEGQRKLRHLFLFNDVLVCAKYKQASNKSEKFTFQLKWYIPLWNALIVEEPSCEPREASPANLVGLKTQVAALRDQIYRVDKEDEWKGRRSMSTQSQYHYQQPPQQGGSGHHSKASEKYRRKLAELEAQLVLASPSLLFQVTHKLTGRSYSFFLSSEYERSQWVETLQVLQSSLPANQPPPPEVQKSMSMEELQTWITSCRKFLKTNMGSFLMRSPRDEALLVGDLHFTLHRVQGLTRPVDLYVVLEVDCYGHYFRKCKSQLVCNSTDPVWNEEFIIDLEGSENLRVLVYEQQAQGSVLRGRATLELSRSWLTNRMAEQRISMNDVILTCSMKFVTFEETIRRVPQSKSTGLFGSPIAVSARREKRAVPFIVTSCVREVERRGLTEVGIYRVSGSAADVARLKKAYEANPYEAEQLLKECDIHSVAGTLKLYLRDLPESLFTNSIYTKMFDAYHEPDSEKRKQFYLSLFSQIPQSPNQACIVFLIEHMVRVSQFEQQNKMSLHNLATVFGPTILHGGKEAKAAVRDQQQLTTGTVDVMAQAGILYFFISRRAKGEPIQITERQV